MHYSLYSLCRTSDGSYTCPQLPAVRFVRDEYDPLSRRRAWLVLEDHIVLSRVQTLRDGLRFAARRYCTHARAVVRASFSHHDECYCPDCQRLFERRKSAPQRE